MPTAVAAGRRATPTQERSMPQGISSALGMPSETTTASMLPSKS